MWLWWWLIPRHLSFQVTPQSRHDFKISRISRQNRFPKAFLRISSPLPLLLFLRIYNFLFLSSLFSLCPRLPPSPPFLSHTSFNMYDWRVVATQTERRNEYQSLMKEKGQGPHLCEKFRSLFPSPAAESSVSISHICSKDWAILITLFGYLLGW